MSDSTGRAWLPNAPDNISALIDAPGLYLTGEDHLRLNTFGSVAGAVLALEGRIVAPDSTIVPIVESHQASTTRAVAQQLVTLAEGVLTNLQLRVTSGTVKRGQLFATVELIRGRVGAVQPLGVLLQGYVASSVPLAWPGAAILSSLDGPGAVRTIVGTDPAAGAEVSEAVPTGARWRLRTFSATLVASAAVANRTPVLTIDDGANILWESGDNIAQTAGQAATYRAGVGVPLLTYGARTYQIPLPAELVLLAGYRIRTVTGAIDVGDNYGAPIYCVEEWIEP